MHVYIDKHTCNFRIKIENKIGPNQNDHSWRFERKNKRGVLSALQHKVKSMKLDCFPK